MENFNKTAAEIANIAVKYDLECEGVTNFNDEIDFPVRYNAEAIDTDTLENPLCVYAKSFVCVTMPQNAHTSEEKYLRYKEVAAKLCAVCRPKYIVGAQDGIVKYMVWCDFGENN